MLFNRVRGSAARRTPRPFLSRLLILLLTAGIGMMWASPRVALAHANLITSDPLHGSALPTAPAALIFEFTETLDPGLTQVEVYDVNNILLASGKGEIASDNPALLRFPLETLPDGTYSAVWTVRSTVDGHITTGLISFSVGADSERPMLLPPVGAPDPATDPPPVPEVILRWIIYGLALLTLGIPLFILLIWQPVLKRVKRAEPERDLTAANTDLTARLRRVALLTAAGLAMALLGLIAYLAYEATAGETAGVWIQEMLYLIRGVLGGTLLLAVLIALTLKLFPSTRQSEMWPIAAGLGLPLLFSFSMRGHGAAMELWTAAAMDWLHLVAASAWMGALFPLALAIRTVRHHHSLALSSLIRRFSLIALISVAWIALTGFYSSLVHVQTLEALQITTYGQLVLLKVAVFMGLFALGAINLLVLSPRLRSFPERAARWLERTVRVEMAFGLIVLVIAGALLSTPPAFEALKAQRRQGFVQTVREEGVRLTLRVAPAQPGDNEFGVEVVDPRSGAEQAETTVLLRLTPPDGGVETQTEVDTERREDGRYTARGTYFSALGNWQVEVILRRRGYDDVRHTFLVAVLPTNVGTENPIEATDESIAIGRDLYAQNCVPCHGATGKGDGPVGITLNPQPSDLTQHTQPGLHSDGQLWLWITNGYPGSGIMPAFKEYLTDEERWHLVNYIRTLGQ